MEAKKDPILAASAYLMYDFRRSNGKISDSGRYSIVMNKRTPS